MFHETKQDLLDALVPYFGAGLESNEFCLWVVSEPLTVEEATTVLSRELPALKRALDAGSIEILPSREWYLPEGTVEPKKIIGGWYEKLDRALARGGEGLRVSGNPAERAVRKSPTAEVMQMKTELVKLESTVGAHIGRPALR